MTSSSLAANSNMPVHRSSMHNSKRNGDVPPPQSLRRRQRGRPSATSWTVSVPRTAASPSSSRVARGAARPRLRRPRPSTLLRARGRSFRGRLPSAAAKSTNMAARGAGRRVSDSTHVPVSGSSVLDKILAGRRPHWFVRFLIGCPRILTAPETPSAGASTPPGSRSP